MQPRINSASKTAGFSLIELVITLGLVSFLLLMGGSLTSAWMDRSKVDNAAAMLKSATSFARSMALRNKENLSAESAAVALCIKYSDSAGEISVQRIAPSRSPCIATDINDKLKAFELAEGITIQQNGERLECIAFNANGMSNTSVCSGRFDQEITIGKNHESSIIKLI